MMTYHRVSYSHAHEPPPMTERYHVVSRHDIPATLDSAALAGFLAKDGQFLLPTGLARTCGLSW